MKPNHSSDNLKEKVDLYNFLEDRLLQYVGSGESLFGEEIHDFFARMEKDLLQLYKDYAMGCVPPEQSEDFDEIGKEIHNGYIPDSNDIATIEELRINQGYNQARQDILDNLKGIDNT